MSGTVIVLLALALFLGASGIAALLAGKPSRTRDERIGLRIAGGVLLVLGAVIGLLAWTIAR